MYLESLHYNISWLWIGFLITMHDLSQNFYCWANDKNKCRKVLRKIRVLINVLSQSKLYMKKHLISSIWIFFFKSFDQMTLKIILCVLSHNNLWGPGPQKDIFSVQFYTLTAVWCFVALNNHDIFFLLCNWYLLRKFHQTAVVT